MCCLSPPIGMFPANARSVRLWSAVSNHRVSDSKEVGSITRRADEDANPEEVARLTYASGECSPHSEDPLRGTKTNANYLAAAAACASIFSITMAFDPPRSYTLPVAVTFSPANGSSRKFWPLDGVVSAIGQ
jgi:hypothetical protein